MLARVITLASIVALAALAAEPASAACDAGDRPPAPFDVKAKPKRGAESSAIFFSWRWRFWNKGNRVYWDIEVTNAEGRVVDSRTGVDGSSARANFVKTLEIANLFPGVRRCLRVRARTEALTKGCVSLAWAGPACATTAGAPPPSGPDTCKSAFVWRAATASDRVCVSPATRTETQRENALAGYRRVGGAGSDADRCRSGFVWREAVAGDRVCVSPARRDQARRDNALAAQRRVGG